MLKAMNKGDGGGPSLDGVMDELRIMVENLKKECYAQFVTHPEMDKLEERVDVVNSRLREVERKNSEIEEAAEVTRDHINRHAEDISEIREIVDRLQRQMKEQQAKTDTHERDIQDLLEKLNALNDKIRDIEIALANSSTGDLDELLKKLKELEK